MSITIKVRATGGAEHTLTVPSPTVTPSSTLPAVIGTSFYVSPSGNDSNPGTSPQLSWRTLDRAMQQNYRAIDALLFQCGGEYFGQIDKVPTASGTNRFLIAYYGSGAKPIITAAKILNIPSAWSQHTTGVWKIALNNPATHNGWKGTIASNGGSVANVGHLKVDGVIRAVKRSGPINPWEFYNDSTTLYVKANANPTTLAGEIRAAPDGHLIFAHSNMEINGLDLRNTGGHGIMRGWQGSPSNVRIINNRIYDIGGSWLSGTTRYGNGVEIFGPGGSNWHIQGNEIGYTYDTPFTCQGSGTWSNIRVTRNFMHHSGIGLEMWATGGGGMSNIVIDDNDLQDGGYGWGADVRPDKDKRSGVITYPWAAPMDIQFKNNRIRRSFVYRWHETTYAGMVFTNNDIQLPSGTLMQRGQSYTINNAAAWRTANNTEIGSTFTVL